MTLILLSDMHSCLTADFSIKDKTDNEFHRLNDNNIDIDSDIIETTIKAYLG